MKKIVVVLITIFIYSQSLFSIVLGLSELEVHTESMYLNTDEKIELSLKEKMCTDILYKYLIDTPLPERMRFERLNNKAFLQMPIKSTLEAEEACYLTNLEYVIFGKLKKTEQFYDVRINIYSAIEQKVVAFFYAKNVNQDIETFIHEVGEKLVAELMQELKFSLEKTDKKSDLNVFDYLLFHNASGYFIPMDVWWSTLTGLVNIFDTGVYLGIIPLYEINKIALLRMRLGQTISYSLGINKPGLVKTYFHQLHFKIPVYFAIELYQRYGIFIETGPAIQFDIAVQLESYMEDRVETAVAFCIFVAVGFEYWIGKNKHVCIGIKNTFDFTFYNQFWADYRPQFYIANKLKIEKRGKK